MCIVISTGANRKLLLRVYEIRSNLEIRHVSNSMVRVNLVKKKKKIDKNKGDDKDTMEIWTSFGLPANLNLI